MLICVYLQRDLKSKCNKKMNFLSFSGGCGQRIGEAISDFYDKTIKNIFVPDINGTQLIIFIIMWVRSWDPVRC